MVPHPVGTFFETFVCSAGMQQCNSPYVIIPPGLQFCSCKFTVYLIKSSKKWYRHNDQSLDMDIVLPLNMAAAGQSVKKMQKWWQ